MSPNKDETNRTKWPVNKTKGGKQKAESSVLGRVTVLPLKTHSHTRTDKHTHTHTFFASPCGSLNDFSRHASNVPGLSALCRPEHVGISKQWNLWAEIEFITTLPALITSPNGAAIRAMGFDFQVFYWSTFWISPPSSGTAPPPVTFAPHKHSINMSVCVCVFSETWLNAVLL